MESNSDREFERKYDFLIKRPFLVWLIVATSLLIKVGILILIIFLVRHFISEISFLFSLFLSVFIYFIFQKLWNETFRPAKNPTKVFTNNIAPEDEAKIPDFSEYKKNLEKLKTVDFSKIPFDKIGDVFYDHTFTYHHVYLVVSPTVFNSQKFFRVRMNIDINKENINSSKTFGAPPSSVINKNGRANLKEKSVFYCSEDPFTSILESKPQVGDIGYLSIWETIAQEDIKHVNFLPSDLDPRNQKWRNISKEDHFFVENQARPKNEQLAALNDFIVEKFKTEIEPYSLSSWIADFVLYNNSSNTDYIVYPSIVADGIRCNMAFHPDSAKKNLKLSKILMFKYEGYEGIGGSMKLSWIKAGHFYDFRREIILELGRSYSESEIDSLMNDEIIWTEATKLEIEFMEKY